jgi:hypothetical protein
MILFISLLGLFTVLLHRSSASTLKMNIYFPESQLDMNVVNADPYQSIWYLWIYSCMESHINSDNKMYTFGTNECPGGEINRNYPVPSNSTFFPNYTVSNLYDHVSENYWQASLNLGDSYLGRIYVAITNVVSGYGVTVPGCLYGNNPATTNPTCSQIGMPWTQVVTSTDQTVELFMFPAFGDQQVGGEFMYNNSSKCLCHSNILTIHSVPPW